MTDRELELLEDVLASNAALLQEIRKLRTGELVARLSEADRDQIAAQVFERVDERLAPLDDDQHTDGAPRRRGRGSSGYFRT
jgi:hypothetical protein